MTQKSDRSEKNQIKISGSAITGDVFIGKKSTNLSQTITLEDFRKLLAELRENVSTAGLGIDILEVIHADINIVESQSKKDEPNKAIILSKLKAIAEVLASMVGIASSTEKLLPMVNNAIDWAQQLFQSIKA